MRDMASFNTISQDAQNLITVYLSTSNLPIYSFWDWSVIFGERENNSEIMKLTSATTDKVGFITITEWRLVFKNELWGYGKATS